MRCCQAWRRKLAFLAFLFGCAIYVQVAAVQCAEPEARVSAALNALQDELSKNRRAAAYELADFHSKAAHALGRIGPKAEAAVPALRVAVKNANVDARAAARLALWRITGDEKQARLAIDEAAEAKATAPLLNSALWISSLGPTGAPLLVDCLKHSNSKVRSTSAYALLEMVYKWKDFGPSTKRAVSALTDALRDTDEDTRKHAAHALGAIDPEAAKQAGVDTRD